MKKFLLTLLAALLFSAAEASNNLENTTAFTCFRNTFAASPQSVSLTNMRGYAGGYEAYMNISRGTGVVELIGSGKRTLRVKSYQGNVLIVNAYLNGSYIGYYKGKLTNYSYWSKYEGVFYNTRTGGKVNFYFDNCYE